MIMANYKYNKYKKKFKNCAEKEKCKSAVLRNISIFFSCSFIFVIYERSSKGFHTLIYLFSYLLVSFFVRSFPILYVFIFRLVYLFICLFTAFIYF